ncbi:response regulator [Terriglobus sp. RCC_193]|uniref:hybrid sensor histidine kinase/response regulator n=1 Tax=Terriglobus sp. RCC_193 TaxID=3239218 RepID=UPI003525CC75
MDNFEDLSFFDMFRMEAEEHSESMQGLLLNMKEGESNAEMLRSLMRGAHSLKGAARVVGLTDIVKLTHAMEDRVVAAQEGRALRAEDVDTLLAANDLLRAFAALSEPESAGWLESRASRVEELATQLAAADVTEASPVARQWASIPEVEDGIMTPADEVDTESAAQQNPEATQGAVGGVQNLRITAQRFDRILGSASDALVKAQAVVRTHERLQTDSDSLRRMLHDLSESLRGTATPDARELLAEITSRTSDLQLHLTELERGATEAEHATGHLHREILQARLRPFQDIVFGLRRLLRDLSQELGKQVNFVITGERTEVDRDILDRLRAPLEHILRNALDHGLEGPKERMDAGKPVQGTITLYARHENGRLVITLRDDGKGVSIPQVLDRAVKRGLVQANVGSRLADNEILEFLFLPGFSTRDTVTEISGRGFGLDVVQSMVHEAGGAVRIESTLGKGTAFHLTLPVTRSLMRVLIVEGEGEIYAIPLVRLSRVVSGMVRAGEDGVPVFEAENESAIPVLPIVDALGGGGTIEPGDATVLLLIDYTGQEIPLALQVDRILGDDTVAVRQLDERFGKMPAIAAVTITEEGAPLLIVEPDNLLRSAQNVQRRRIAGASADEQARVLVVDDSPTVRQMLRRTLIRADYRVTLASNGVEAWGILQVEDFDLLVSDVDMPEMNGIELIENLRANARIGSMPAILLSYKGREQDRQRGLQAGADAYVTKGEFEETTFLQLVEDLIGPARMPATAEESAEDAH